MMENDSIPLLREILVWTKVGHFNQVLNMLEKVLDSDKSRLAYQAMDGTRTADSVTKEVQMSSRDIVELFRRCESTGLMATQNGKRTRLFDLADFGLLPRG